MRKLLGVGAVAAVMVLPAVAMADTASAYNLFVLGDMNAKWSDTEGRVAVKGSANLSGYTVGANASGSGVNFVVGQNLTENGGSTNGMTYVGGTSSFTNFGAPDLTPPGTAIPVDFATEQSRLDALTTTLSNYADTGTVGTVPWGGQFTVDAATSGVGGLNVFSISGAALASSNTFTIDLAPGQTVLINVDGSADSMTGGLNIVGGDASQVLWNFSDATTLSFANIALLGSVLAPNANYLGGWGQLDGELIVKSFSDTYGATQINSGYNLVGDLMNPPTTGVPEPAAWALMILGFGAMGAMLRRRRRLAAA